MTHRATYLPPAQPREKLHSRRLNLDGYRRADGMWEIEGELIDFKNLPWPSPEKGVMEPGEPVHHMVVRLELDDEFVVTGVHGVMKSHPFPECAGALPELTSLVGEKASAGWRKTVNTVLADTRGCTHIRELLVCMGAVAYQTVAGERPSSGGTLPGEGAVPPHLGKCISWDFKGAVMLRHFPLLHRKG